MIYNAPEGVSGQLPEFVQSFALKNQEQSLIGIDDLLVAVCVIDQKTAGHFLHKADDLAGGTGVVRIGKGRRIPFIAFRKYVFD